MRQRRCGRFKILVLATCALSLVSLAAQAQSQVKTYNVQGGALKSALRQFARQSDSEILFDGAMLAGKRTRGFTGQGTAQEVLASLLDDANLTYRQTVLTV